MHEVVGMGVKLCERVSERERTSESEWMSVGEGNNDESERYCVGESEQARERASESKRTWGEG